VRLKYLGMARRSLTAGLFSEPPFRTLGEVLVTPDPLEFRTKILAVRSDVAGCLLANLKQGGVGATIITLSSSVCRLPFLHWTLCIG